MIWSSPGSATAARAGLAVGAVLLAAVASGCSAGQGSGSGHGQAAPKPISPIKAIDLAAAQQVRSLAAKISIGTDSGQVTATMDARFRPETFIAMALRSSAAVGSAPTSIKEILTSKALYLADPALKGLTKKPWIKMTFAQISSKAGISIKPLLQNLENSNPENQVKLFAVAKNIHAVGSQTINGVATTEYAGSYQASAALAKLPTSLRKMMRPVLTLMGNTPIRFRVWIDAQHLARKAIVDERVSGRSIVTTYTITSVNQPVNVPLPPRSEVASVP
jgi:hypothetical protein